MSKRVPDKDHNNSLKKLSIIIDGVRYVEKWTPIKRYSTRYHISTFGRIKSLKRKVARKNGSFHVQKAMIKRKRLSKWGYETVYLAVKKSYKHYMVHVLVAKHFISKKPSKTHQVNHKDGNKRNNYISNLEWVTPGENKKHAYRIGLMCQKGERHATLKLNNKKVLEIFYSSENTGILAKKYNISTGTVYGIKSGRSWSHLTNKVYEKKKPENIN